MSQQPVIIDEYVKINSPEVNKEISEFIESKVKPTIRKNKGTLILYSTPHMANPFFKCK